MGILYLYIIGMLVLALNIKKSEGRYLFMGAGVAQRTEEIIIPVYFTEMGLRTHTDSGYVFQGGLGWHINDRLRLETEISHRSCKVKELTVSYSNVDGLGVENGNGEVSSTSFMADSWYDFMITEKVIPYVGGGIGVAKIALNDISIHTYPIVPNAARTRRELVDDTDWKFAYEFGLGVGFALNRYISFDAGYRFFASLNPEFTDLGGNTIKSTYASHNFILSIKYKFNVP